MAQFVEQDVRVAKVTAYCDCGGVLAAMPISQAITVEGCFKIKHVCVKCELAEYLTEPYPALRYYPVEKLPDSCAVFRYHSRVSVNSERLAKSKELRVYEVAFDGTNCRLLELLPGADKDWVIRRTDNNIDIHVMNNPPDSECENLFIAVTDGRAQEEDLIKHLKQVK